MRAVELGTDVRGAEKQVLSRVKELENEGYQFEAAEGSFELLVRRAQPDHRPPFEILDVVRDLRAAAGQRHVRRGHGQAAGGRRRPVHTVAEGAGPVHALDQAFHKALDPHYPLLREVKLSDYKVRILDPEAATGAKTRVLIESSCHGERWSTIGVSPNIIEASCRALADALELPLVRSQSQRAKDASSSA